MLQYNQETPAEREMKNMRSANLTLSFPRYARSWIRGRAGGPLHTPPESARTKALRVKTSIVAKTSYYCIRILEGRIRIFGVVGAK